MANSSSKDIQIWITDLGVLGVGGSALVDVTSQVQAINGINIENLTEEANPFGSANVFHEDVGIGQIADITLSAFYDPAGTLYPYLNNAAYRKKTIKIAYGPSSLSPNRPFRQATVIIASRGLPVERNRLTRQDYTLRFGGDLVEDEE